jgi:hypothetical protein
MIDEKLLEVIIKMTEILKDLSNKCKGLEARIELLTIKMENLESKIKVLNG